jgi:hypothetical protein
MAEGLTRLSHATLSSCAPCSPRTRTAAAGLLQLPHAHGPPPGPFNILREATRCPLRTHLAERSGSDSKQRQATAFAQGAFGWSTRHWGRKDRDDLLTV